MLTTLINFWYFARLKPTKKTRQQLRNQKVMFEGKAIKAVFRIEQLVKSMAPMMVGSKPVCHLFKLNKLYFKYDLAGVNYYKRIMSQVVMKQMKKSIKIQKQNLKKLINEKANNL